MDHDRCRCLLAGWKDEGEGIRGKGDDDERWYSRPSTNMQTPSSPCKRDVRPSDVLTLTHMLHAYKPLLVGWIASMHSRQHTIGVDRRWRRGTCGSRGVLEDP